MSLYKNLVNALFKLSGGQAMPSDKPDNIITIFQGNAAYNKTLIAPNDGYYSIDGSSDEVKTTYIQASVLSFITGSGRHSIYAPCRKGQPVSLVTTASSDVVVRFRTLIGGGLRAFLRKLFGVCGEVCYG